MDRREIGNLGENAVACYLEKKGYIIRKRNFRVRGGEIDIIAEKDGILAFVEVKTRMPDPLVNGFEAITAAKKNMMIRTSEAYSIKFPHDLQPRFDVAWVTVDNGKVVDFRYIDNAFDASA